MIPSRYLADYRSAGEELVYETLRDHAPSSWIVLHSLDIAPSDERRRGEADFVVIVPGQGCAVLEVKSVARQNADRTWDYGGNVRSERSPFDQADAAMRSVLGFLRDTGATRRPFVCSGVVTPFGDITSAAGSAKTIEWNEWQAIGRSVLQGNGLAKAVERLIARERESEGRPCTEFDPATIADVLRPRFDFYVSPAARRQRLEEEIRRYTEEQFDALDDFEANTQLLVLGPAGCGKTLLAIELARRAVESGQSALLVCYNRLLGDWLEDQVRPLGYLAKATTLESFMLHVSGLRIPSTATSGFWEEDLPLTAAARYAARLERFDVLIVDEAQDVVSSERLMFLDECLEGGLSSGRWVFFGDFDSQMLRPGVQQTDPILALSELTGRRPFVRRLRRNCRNTRAVAHFAERVARIPDEYRYSSCLRGDEGEAPTIIELETLGGPPEAALAEVLSGLRSDGFANDEIAVLSVVPSAASLAAALANTERWRDILTPAAHPLAGRIRYDTIRRFKGLESSVVVVTDLAASSADDEKELRDLMYVAATRSLHSLYVITESKAAKRLDLLQASGRP